MTMKNILIISIIFLNYNFYSQAKFETNKQGSDYSFKVIKDLEATDVQNQGRTSTCWSFLLYRFLNQKLFELNKRNTISQKCLLQEMLI